MATCAFILGDPPQRLWGLCSRQRLERQLRAAGITRRLDSLALVGGDDTVLLLNAGYVFEQRTLSGLLRQDASLLQCPDDGGIAAGVAPATRAAEFAAIVAHTSADRPTGATLMGPQSIDAYDDQLRKAEPPLLAPLRDDNRAALEAVLYGNSYKGITDLVTKWLWPRPARQVVRLCANAGITPNMVTLTGLLLVVAASWLFLHGHYWSGLACGWLMTLLDTVDGKLARVTIQSSPLGHWLDHGMDIVHPPIWYVTWGMGLDDYEPLAGLELNDLYWLIIGGYLFGRAIEALFHALGRCSMFAWRPFDAYFRLVTARRNPCLIILTAAVLVDRPAWGLLGVALWTVLSSAVMLGRLLYATYVRVSTGPLESWLKDPNAAATVYASAYRTFSGTRSAYG